MSDKRFRYPYKKQRIDRCCFYIPTDRHIRPDVDVAYHLLAELLSESGFNVGGYSVSLLHTDVGFCTFMCTSIMAGVRCGGCAGGGRAHTVGAILSLRLF